MPGYWRGQKGMRLIFLKLSLDYVWQHKFVQKRQCEPLEELSFLFNSLAALKLVYPEIRQLDWKSPLIMRGQGAPTMALENLSKRLISAEIVPESASGLQGE